MCRRCGLKVNVPFLYLEHRRRWEKSCCESRVQINVFVQICKCHLKSQHSQARGWCNLRMRPSFTTAREKDSRHHATHHLHSTCVRACVCVCADVWGKKCAISRAWKRFNLCITSGREPSIWQTKSVAVSLDYRTLFAACWLNRKWSELNRQAKRMILVLSHSNWSFLHECFCWRRENVLLLALLSKSSFCTVCEASTSNKRAVLSIVESVDEESLRPDNKVMG